MSTFLNALGTDKFKVRATIDPDAYGTGTQNSDSIDMRDFESVMFILAVGDIAATGTVDMAIKSSDDNSTFDSTIKAITQLTAAGTDSDKQVIVNVRAEDLPEGDRYVRAEVTIGTAACDLGLIALAHNATPAGANTGHLSTVDEVLNSGPF
jgi:hypothetical protein